MLIFLIRSTCFFLFRWCLFHIFFIYPVVQINSIFAEDTPMYTIKATCGLVLRIFVSICKHHLYSLSRHMQWYSLVYDTLVPVSLSQQTHTYTPNYVIKKNRTRALCIICLVIFGSVELEQTDRQTSNKRERNKAKWERDR